MFCLQASRNKRAHSNIRLNMFLQLSGELSCWPCPFLLFFIACKKQKLRCNCVKFSCRASGPWKARWICYNMVCTCQVRKGTFLASASQSLLGTFQREAVLLVMPHRNHGEGRLCSTRNEQVWVAKGKRIWNGRKQNMPSWNAIQAMIPATLCAEEPGNQ